MDFQSFRRTRIAKQVNPRRVRVEACRSLPVGAFEYIQKLFEVFWQRRGKGHSLLRSRVRKREAHSVQSLPREEICVQLLELRFSAAVGGITEKGVTRV